MSEPQQWDDSEYCRNCGELMIGSGCFEPVHCPHVTLTADDLSDGLVEEPIYCNDDLDSAITLALGEAE